MTSSRVSARKGAGSALVVAGALALLVAIVWLALRGEGPASEPLDDRVQSSTPIAAADANVDEAPVRPSALVADAAPPPATASVADDPPRSHEHARILTGRVLDLRTAEPIPAVSVRVSTLGHAEELVTDLAGTFQTHAAFEDRGFDVVVLDGGVELGRFAYDALPRVAFDLRVAIGPTCPFRALPSFVIGHPAWRARLREVAREEDESGAIAVGATLSLARSALPDRAWTEVPLRLGATPWVRWPKREHEPKDGYRVRLEIVNRELGLFARTTVPSTVGRQPERDLVAPSSIATLEGRLAWSSLATKRGPLSARVTLVPASPAEILAPRTWDKVEASADGVFRFDLVDPGKKRIVIEPTKQGRLETDELDLLPGWNAPLDPFLLDDEPEAAAPAPRLQDEDPPDVPIEILARPAACDSFRGATVLSFESERWEPTRLPAGRYAIEIAHLRASFDRACWEVESSLVDWPVEPVRLAVAWVDERSTWAPRVLDARTRRPVDGATVWFGARPTRGLHWPADGPGGSPGWLFPPGEPKEWNVAAAGHVVAHGDAKALAALSDGEVVLQHGFGAEIVFRERETPEFRGPVPSELAVEAAPPVAGVELRVGNELVASSDALGRAWVTSPRAPDELRVRIRGWKLVAVTALEGAPRDAACVAWLERER